MNYNALTVMSLESFPNGLMTIVLSGLVNYCSSAIFVDDLFWVIMGILWLHDRFIIGYIYTYDGYIVGYIYIYQQYLYIKHPTIDIPNGTYPFLSID